VKATVIILGRGGSKGLARKNLLPIAGKPCVQWTIEAALDCDLITTVAVSSDDAEMLALARTAGCIAIERPADLASDSARVDDAARHAVQTLQSRGAMDASAPLVILYANVPVRPEGCIGRALSRLIETSCDSVQTYQPVGKHHPWWTARVDEKSGVVAPWEGDMLNHGVFRRQDLPPAFIPDGAAIALTSRALMLEIPGVAPGPHAFFGLDRRGVVNPEGSVVDIDARLDLIVADAMLGAAPSEPRPSGSGPAVNAQPPGSLVPASAPTRYPHAYFLTFRTYGSWLPGDERGATKDRNELPGELVIPASPSLEEHSRALMKDDPFVMTSRESWRVERTIQEVCAFRGWSLWAFAVRSNHVHVVVSAQQPPEPLITAFKAWSTRRLREDSLISSERIVWAGQGSTRYLWDRDQLLHACRYVLHEQGPPLGQGAADDAG
jgi:CMP-N,N'-diacetyllegionaminic acid synthase